MNPKINLIDKVICGPSALDRVVSEVDAPNIVHVGVLLLRANKPVVVGLIVFGGVAVFLAIDRTP